MLKKSFFFLFLFATVWSVVPCTAQAPFVRSNSPYSRYGMGDLFSLAYPAVGSNGLGGAYNSHYDINLINPASLSELRHIAFDIGVYYQHSWMNEPSTGKKARANDGNLSYFSLAFPIWRPWKFEKDTLRRMPPIHWGMTLGLMPHSRAGYSVRVERELANIGKVLFNYEGQGTRFLVNWGNGFKYKGFSLGVNLGFLFGKVTHTANEYFQDSTYNTAYDNATIRSQYARGLLWNLGAQYEHVFKSKKSTETNRLGDLHLNIGVYGNAGSTLYTENSQLTRRTALYYPADTIIVLPDVRGKIRMPGQIGGGFSLSKETQWQFGANVQYDAWSVFQDDQNPGISRNTLTVSAGGEYWIFYGDENMRQTEQFRREMFKKIILRLGGYFGKDPRTLQSGTESYQLNKYGITFGLGIPIRTSDAQDKEPHPMLLNLGLEYGYLGHQALVHERFFKINLGFTLTGDKWFIRPKFR